MEEIEEIVINTIKPELPERYVIDHAERAQENMRNLATPWTDFTEEIAPDGVLIYPDPEIISVASTKRFQCTHCPAVFIYKKSYDNHLKKHEVEGIPPLEIVEIGTEEELTPVSAPIGTPAPIGDYLAYNYNDVKETSANNASCSLCDKCYTGKGAKSNMKMHTKYEHWKDPDTMEDISVIMKPKSYCFICEKNCGINLKAHMKANKQTHETYKHTNLRDEKRKQCPHCPTSYVYPGKLNSHILLKHSDIGNDTLEIVELDQDPNDTTELGCDIIEANCSLCNKGAYKGINAKQKFYNHMKYQHWKDAKTNEEIPGMKAKCYCFICDKNFGSLLKKHTDKHHAHSENAATLVPCCHYGCNGIFKDVDDLTEHVRLSHVQPDENDEGDTYCPICGKHIKRLLRRHLRRAHKMKFDDDQSTLITVETSNNRPNTDTDKFIQHLKVFNSMKSLDLEYQLERSDGLLWCKLCHKVFIKESKCVEHIRSTHLGGRYYCPGCDRTFITNWSFSQHKAG